MAETGSRGLTPASRAAERAGRRIPNLYEFLRIYQHVVREFGDRGLSALDYGCGSGYGTHLLAEHFARVCGVDVHESTVNECRATYPATNLQFDVLRPPTQPYPDESFDVITSFQVAEHVPDDQLEAYFAGIWRMLKPGGTAMVTTPNGHNYFHGHSGNPHHIREWQASEFRSLVGRYWPTEQTVFRAQRDVLSNSTGIRIRRALRGHRIAWPVARVAVGPLRVLERAGVVSPDRRRLFTDEDYDNEVGSLYVEVHKPAH